MPDPNWWIEREDGDRIDGPYSTQADAMLARVWVEKVLKPETFWVRGGAVTPEHPVTVGDLLVIGVDRIRRPATVADLVSARRAEGVLVGHLITSEWKYDHRVWTLAMSKDVDPLLSKAFLLVPVALAEAQPFPPAGGVS